MDNTPKGWKKKRKPGWRDSVQLFLTFCAAILMVGGLFVLFGYAVDVVVR